MSKMRYTRVFKDGIEQTPEPYEVSDEELAEEVKAKRQANILNELDDHKKKLDNIAKVIGEIQIKLVKL